MNNCMYQIMSRQGQVSKFQNGISIGELFKKYGDTILSRTNVIVECNLSDGLILYLLSIGLNPDSKYDDGITLLGMSCLNGKIDMVKLLLHYGCDVSLKDAHGHSPLFRAVQNEHVEIVKILLENGATQKNYSYSSYSPLLYASVWGKNASITELLLKALKHESLKENTATENQYIARNCLNSCFRDITSSSTQNVPALHYAIASNKWDLALSIIDLYEGAELSGIYDYKCKSLHNEMLLVFRVLFQLLVKRGAYYDVRAKSDQVLLLNASYHCDLKIFCMLAKKTEIQELVRIYECGVNFEKAKQMLSGIAISSELYHFCASLEAASSFELDFQGKERKKPRFGKFKRFKNIQRGRNPNILKMNNFERKKIKKRKSGKKAKIWGIFY